MSFCVACDTQLMFHTPGVVGCWRQVTLQKKKKYIEAKLFRQPDKREIGGRNEEKGRPKRLGGPALELLCRVFDMTTAK